MSDQVAKTYWDHEDFAVSYQMGSQKHRVYILNKLAELEVHTLLDVGCGTGPIYEMLIDQDDTYAPWDNIIAYKGIDYSWRMIETCKRLFFSGEFKVGDARAIKEEDSSWDCVLLMHCLDHLDDYEAAIKEAVRVSKKYIVICLWRPLSPNPTNNLNNRNMYGKAENEEPWEDTHLQDYSKEVLIKEFDKHSLIEVDFCDNEAVNDPGKYNTVWIFKKPL